MRDDGGLPISLYTGRALILAAGLAAVGCSPRLAGTNDLALEYAVEEPDVQPAVVAGELKARLVSARVPADVEATPGGHVRVVVDADMAKAVDELVLWRGGVDLYLGDDAFTLIPPDLEKLRPMSRTRGDGHVTRWWQGPRDEVLKAVRDAPFDAAHTAFAERLSSGDWRTRVVTTPAALTVGDRETPFASVALAEDGRSLALTLSAEAHASLLALRARAPGVEVVFARGSSPLATLPVEQLAENPVVLSFGQDIGAYARARRASLLLHSPLSPALRLATQNRLPPRWGLAAACALLPFVLSFGWLFFVRRFDRTRPEPMWLVAATFGLGGVSVLPAALVETGLAGSSEWLDPALMTLGGQLWALPIALVALSLSPGAVEEGAKWLSAWSLARHRREFDEPVDGVVYGCAAALGFAAVENVKYFAIGRMSGVVIATRAFMTVPAHMFFGALWGYAMGRSLVSRRARVLTFFSCAALAHGAFDACLSIEGAEFGAVAVVLVLACAFVVLLRNALRYGAVPARRPSAGPSAGDSPPSSSLERLCFPVGSPLAFYASAASMIVLSVALTGLGVGYELLQHRVGFGFVCAATVLLALFALAAHGTSSTMPLDVVLDARGVTFAGGQTPWTSILRVGVLDKRRRWSFVELGRADGALRLGPARRDDAIALAAAIARAAGRPGP